MALSAEPVPIVVDTDEVGIVERASIAHCQDATGDPEVRTIARRGALALLALATAMSAIGGVGVLVFFDGSLGTRESDAVAWISDHRIGVLDVVATVGSSLSDTWTVLGILFGAAMMLLATGHRRCTSLLLTGISLEFVTFLIVGNLIGRARPDVVALHSVPSTASFPSGHVAGAFVLYGSLTLIGRTIAPDRVPRWTWLLPVAAASAVACSRVYEGVHYPSDVVAGFVLGVGALVGAAWANGVIGRDLPHDSPGG